VGSSPTIRTRKKNMNKNFVVIWNHQPLVIIKGAIFITGGELLDWYAKEYDFDRSKLSGGWCDDIPYEK
jgi:hypothetical protein